MKSRYFDKRFKAPVLGIDEVGLGSIAGPLHVCGVVLPSHDVVIKALEATGVRDSKKLSDSSRQRIYDFVKEHDIWHKVMSASVTEINEYGSYSCVSILCRKIIAAAKEDASVETVLIDGKNRKDVGFSHEGIVDGDQKSLAIATASVIAKVERDKLMTIMGNVFPQYEWAKNKGYATKRHVDALHVHGPTGQHRNKYEPVVTATESRESLLEGD
tara:strand:- start:11881 stop:12525 length:645 start_codon:yes stop_codon:yes gene_type:complete